MTIKDAAEWLRVYIRKNGDNACYRAATDRRTIGETNFPCMGEPMQGNTMKKTILVGYYCLASVGASSICSAPQRPLRMSRMLAETQRVHSLRLSQYTRAT